jgi:uncharacterized protein YkwD
VRGFSPPVHAALLVLALIGLPAPAAEAGSPDSALRGFVNAERRANGLTGLNPSPALARSAGRYARSLLRRGVLAHAPRIAAPRRFRLLGENLARISGGPQPRRVVRMWMGSPAHRQIVLHPAVRRFGVGRATGRFHGWRTTVWLLHVGRI